ncbi:hypothetical protein QGQ84_08075 [Bacillus safensis]|uniref:hypothetical protein n=1 Tax=Bacillus safensis TaxID=561879 RepID=UPI002481C008|nr:hypothetical protein [Bacillus safensis]MDI0273533.1 hypothetical protein [Bacillus safensis]
MEINGNLLDGMKNRNMIRTSNLVGDWGERLAIKYYNEDPMLPNLQAVRIGAISVDAINMKNERYSIKAITTKTTGLFNGLNDKGSKMLQEPIFEYVVIVSLSNNMSLEAIYELDWKNFLSLKKWNESKRTWYLSITGKLKSKAKTLYDIDSDIAM